MNGDPDEAREARLLAALGRVLGPDPLPHGLVARAEDLFTVKDMDSELVELLDRSAAEPAGMRGGSVASRLEFELGDGTVALELVPERDRLVGQLLAGEATEVTLERPAGAAATASLDEMGRFFFDAVGNGPVRLRLALGGWRTCHDRLVPTLIEGSAMMIYIGQQQRARRWGMATILVVFTTALGLVLPAPSARAAAASVPPPTPPPTALATADALVAAFGANATVDDSSATQCMNTPAVPLAYRTDQIILRPSPSVTTSAAVGQLTAALRAEMGPGTFTVGVPETITWDAAADPGVIPRIASASSSVTAEKAIWRVVAVPIHALNEEDVPIVRVARRLRAEGLPTSPDYLMIPGNGPLGVWPEGGPQLATAAGTPRPGLGAGTTVAIYDTGVPDDSQANLPPNLTRSSGNDVERPDRDGDGQADLYYSVHLTAIAGIFATLVPDATVLGVRITGSSGVATDFSAAKRMATTLRSANDKGMWPQVIVNSFGSPVCKVGAADPTADMLPLGLQMVAEAVDRHEEAVVVASAGNSGTDRPHYPAAFHTAIPSIISVGALDATTDGGLDPWTSASRSAQPASFSNYGSWVAAWAPGISLPTYHAIGLTFEANGQTINGFATVNGTSFAAPYVGGLILEDLALSGLTQTPQQAWDDVRGSGRACAAAVGGGTAVALAGPQATATTAADATAATQC